MSVNLFKEEDGWRPFETEESIVYCGECKWSEPHGDSDVLLDCVQWDMTKHVTQLDFCSYGKRVSEED